ncbi:MAG: S4 domain-containing protein [Mariprofundaceae bacterium]
MKVFVQYLAICLASPYAQRHDVPALAAIRGFNEQYSVQASLMAVRIDKWLWAARFYKTRGLATEQVNGGHVQLNGEHVKPSKQIDCGDELVIVREQETFTVRVTGLAEKRGAAAIARTLYKESEESLKARELEKERRRLDKSSAPKKRPDKKARRQIIRFVRQED